MDRMAAIDWITDQLDTLTPVAREDEVARDLLMEATAGLPQAEKLLMSEACMEMVDRTPVQVHRKTTDLALLQVRNRLRLLEIRVRTQE